jgi:hypothetical protein
MDSPDVFALKNRVPSKDAEELAKKMLPDIYNRILVVLDTYLDTTVENKQIIAIWIIGTYVHKRFISFPRLFINAMKGSGKSRLLQILKALCWNATVQTNMSEAVLFRNASKQTFLFDESEGISSKEQNTIRELLNAGYKRGTEVKRMRKSFTKDGEQQIVETFDLYSPVALANINGMEDVLGDRCVTIVLEKSKDPSRTLLLEDFEENMLIRDLKFALTTILVYECMCICPPETVVKYNVYTLSTHTTLTTLIPQTTLYHLKPLLLNEEMDFSITEEEMEFFKRIHETNLDGRNLEIFFPLFNIAKSISEEVFNNVCEIAKEYVLERTKQDRLENTDWSFIDFIARQPATLNYVPVAEMVKGFKEFYALDDVDWLNSHWVGQSLKRLKLSLNKRRIGKGVEYILNVAKAQDRLKIFKMTDDKVKEDEDEKEI